MSTFKISTRDENGNTLSGNLVLTPTVSPPPTPPPSPPPPPTGGGQHTVTISVTDSTPTAWQIVAHVGEDWTVDGQYLPFKDVSGGTHPALRARVYSDCVDIGTVPGSSTTDYSGTLSVTYDGTQIFGPQMVQFPRGCFNKTLRYGPQAPWKSVDLSLFPNWAKPTTALPLANLSKYDLTYNGLGVATYRGMGSTGSRPDIAYVPEWDVPFCLQPSLSSYAIVRAAADNSGCWPIYFMDDTTGLPYDITQFPNTSFLPYGQVVFKNNPIAEYAPDKARISGAKRGWDEAHETGYNFVAAAASGTARDKFHCAVWANAVLTASNPIYRSTNGVWQHYQERGSAWALRSLFLASYLATNPSYFQARLAEQLVLANALPQNKFGLLATYFGELPAPNGLGTALAVWQENYVRFVLDVIASKIPAWQPFTHYLGGFIPQVLAGNTYPLSTLYSWTCKDVNHNFLPSIQAMMEVSLTANWSAADAAAATAPNVTLAQVYALQQKYGFKGKLGDLAQYDAAPDDYPALMRAATIAAVDAGVAGADVCWTLMQSLPTQPDFSREWGFNIVPRSAS